MQAPSDREPFEKLVSQHFALYPTVGRMSEITFSSWWDELKDVPLEVLPGAFKKARTASPNLMPPAAAVKNLAEVEAAYLAKARAERRQERLFPEPTQATGIPALQEFYAACDKALDELGEREPQDADVMAITSLCALLFRRWGITERSDAEFYGRVYVNDAKARGVGIGELVHGLRKVPAFCRRPPSLGMVMDLARGGPMAGYPQDWVAPAGDAL